MNDPIRPTHYKEFSIEPLAAIQSWGLNFCLGNVVKYVARSGRKGCAIEDLKKAQEYLAREISSRIEQSLNPNV